MTRTEQLGFVRLAADGGYLYNGAIVATVVCAPAGADLAAWQEITTAEGDTIKTARAAARAAALAQAQEEAAAAAEREAHEVSPADSDAATPADAADGEASPADSE